MRAKISRARIRCSRRSTLSIQITWTTQTPNRVSIQTRQATCRGRKVSLFTTAECRPQSLNFIDTITIRTLGEVCKATRIIWMEAQVIQMMQQKMAIYH